MEDVRARLTALRAELQAEMALMDEAAVSWFDARAGGARDLRAEHHEWQVHERATRRLERTLKKLERKLEHPQGGERA